MAGVDDNLSTSKHNGNAGELHGNTMSGLTIISIMTENAP